MPTSTLSLYLKCLLENEVIERTKIGYENIFTIKDEDRIAKLIIAYQTSFSDKLVDRWASTWLERRFGKKAQKNSLE
jgi:hypothetical protein